MGPRLLQVLPSVLISVCNELAIEVDCYESIRLYLDNFDQVTVACPVATQTSDSGLRRCRPVNDLPLKDRIRFIPLPNAYDLRGFISHYQSVKRLLKAEIEAADYLVFSPHSFIGDWPTVAAREAIKLSRPYVIEADVVYGEVARVGWARAPFWKQFIRKNAVLPLLQRIHRYCLKHSNLALLQGQDVYDAYSPFCQNAHKVYHMPISKEDYITNSQLQMKLNALDENRPLRISYVGRVIDMKGPLDWLEVLCRVMERGVAIDAKWLGDGSLLPKMRAAAENLGIADKVRFVGYVSDREKILQTLRDLDIFLFCHKTPESPRCLVEALASGCPLIGYGGGYPRELTAERGGGQFASVDNRVELADLVTALNENRGKLREMIRAASASGELYERDATMQQRIELIKQYLGPKFH